MFIAVNKVAAPPAHHQAIIDAFTKAAPAMKEFAGFLGLEIWTGEDNTLLAVSRWESKEAMDEYSRSSLFGQHHGGAPSNRDNQGSQSTYYTAQVLS